MIITLDFETFYRGKQKGEKLAYTLTSLSYTDYVHNPLFRVEGVGIKVNDQPTTFHPPGEVEEALRTHKWGPGTTLIAHNAPFDTYILAAVYGIRPDNVVDTLGLARALMPGMKHDLGNTAIALRLGGKDKEILNMAKGRHYEELTEEEQQLYAAYCINDVELTYQIAQKLLPGMPANELKLMNHAIQAWITPTLEVNIPQARQALADATNEERRTVRASGYTATQLSSNPQFAEILQKLGMTPPTKLSKTTSKETWAFGKKDYDFLQLIAAHPEHKALFDGRFAAKSKILTTRLKRMIDTAEKTGGKLPVLLNYYGAEQTGRYSGGNKMNPQNLSARGPGKVMRTCIRAPEGRILGIADSSQIEARVMALLAGEEKLLELFRTRQCPYSDFASAIYRCPVSKADPSTHTMRYVGKTGILSLQYGVAWRTLQNALAVGDPAVYQTNAESMEIVSLYRTRYNNISALWHIGDQILFDMHEGRQGGHSCISWDRRGILLPNGMRIRYPLLRRTEDGWKFGVDSEKNIYGAKVIQNVAQALARIIVADQAMVIHDHYPVHLQVHDEIVASGPLDQAEQMRAFMLETMQTPPDWWPELPIDAEAHTSLIYNK